MFQTIFTQSIENKRIISISMYGETSSWIGFVIAVNEELVTMEHLSKYGRYDGIVTLKIVDIERLDIDDEICRSIHFLYHNKAELERLSKTYENRERNTGDFLAVLSECKEKNLICSVDTKELYLACFVIDVNFEEIHFLAIDEYGQKDGECFVKMEDINYVSCGRLQEMRRLLLYNIHYRI
ncbi:MAG: hypothetical protein WBK38_01000 [Bacteroidia bacterium]|jgi:hypothetical protein